MNNEIKTYPLYNKKNEYIGLCELDNIVKEYDGSFKIYCYDCEGSEYEQNAWNVSRILNFCDPSMPSMYGKENT
jgi:isocitrate dehydrogenase